MRKIIILTIMCSALISGCTIQNTSKNEVTEWKPFLPEQQEQLWSQMLGRWYGSAPTKSGGYKQFINEKRIDGTYKINFRTTKKDGTVEESTEFGYWGVSGPVYFSIFRGWIHGAKVKQADPTNPYNYDAYKIINLTDNSFVYESFSTGNRYSAKRVDYGFIFPK